MSPGAPPPAPDAAAWQRRLVPDAAGACLPGPPGSTADGLPSLAALSRRAPVVAALDAAASRAPPAERAPIAELRDRVASLSALDFVSCFRHPLAFGALGRPAGAEAGRAAWRLARFLVGAPIDDPVSLVIPAGAIGPGGLYLPHLHAIVGGAGPVAIEADLERVRLRWPDGGSATLPAGGVACDVEVRADRLRLLPTRAGLRLLNGVAEIAAEPVGLAAPEQATPFELQTLEAGFDLLERAWPEAYHASRRWFQCAVVLAAPGAHSRSVTTGFLHGSFNASIHDAVQVADALCHEGSHTRLNLFREIDPLLIDDGAETHPSPWRADPRPLKGVLDGVHAFVNVALFYRRLHALGGEASDACRRIFVEQRAKVLDAWGYLTARAVPTELGASFLAELGRAVEALAAEPDGPRPKPRLPLFDLVQTSPPGKASP